MSLHAAGHQSEDGEGAWTYAAAVAPPAGRSGTRVNPPALANAFRFVAAILTVLLFPAVAPAQRPQVESFRVEWSLTPSGFRPAIEGYVYNDSEYRVSSVRLRIEVLDASNRVMSEKFGWVYGDIGARGRAYFVFPAPRSDETYRIAVESFFLVSRQGP